VSTLAIRDAGLERLAELEPLWLSMRDHHASLAQDIAPARSGAESWRRRKDQYLRWLQGDKARLLIAEREGRPVGYAMLTVHPGPSTWDIGERLVEIESLAVAEDARGQGIGAELLAAARSVAREVGAARLSLGVMHANERALRFYEREGFRPFYVELLSEGPSGGEAR
jgi:ribosomal protein S18 acetylase RimI-like enzyme